jgi:hypothetical protein
VRAHGATTSTSVSGTNSMQTNGQTVTINRGEIRLRPKTHIVFVTSMASSLAGAGGFEPPDGGIKIRAVRPTDQRAF